MWWLARAAANGVDLWALTDHDDIGGLAEAKSVAEEVGMGFVTGVEISIEWKGVPIHIVGLGFDAAHPGLVSGLDELRIGRIERAKRMGDALDAIGIPGVYEGAVCLCHQPQPDFARPFCPLLVSIGIARDVSGSSFSIT
jgi:predicted metal-dependent phosphoesterase TrpH